MRAKEKFQRIQEFELIRRGYDVIFIQVGNQRGFLFGEKGTLADVPKRFQLTMEEQRKVPMQKQILDMHMGRKLQQYKTDTRIYMATVMDMPHGGAYTAWELVR